MYKKIFSIIIIMCTVVSVIIMLNNAERRCLHGLSVQKVKQQKITKTKKDVYNKKQELKKKNNNEKNNLSMLDKKKILRIANKLSAIDYCKIQKDLKNNNEEDAINTLKKRLTNSEYKEIEKITEKVIDKGL